MSQTWRSETSTLVGLCLAMAATVAMARDDHRLKPPLRIRVPDVAGMALRRAVLGARQRLGTARCQEVLEDFRPGGASPSLVAALQRLGRTPGEHLDTLTFEDGSRRGACASPAILAFTHPGSDTIFVCASQWKGAVRNDPVYAEMVLIHELLHTLGLGENPPTSLEITARVTERCGDASARRARLRVEPPPARPTVEAPVATVGAGRVFRSAAAELDDSLRSPIALVHGIDDQLISRTGDGEDRSKVGFDDRPVEESHLGVAEDLAAAA